MIFRLIKLLFLFIMLVMSEMNYAQVQKTVSMELQNINLPDALRLLAKFLHLNVIISPAVRGVADLNFTNAMPSQAFQLLLSTHGLAIWKLGNISLVGPQNELIKLKQEEMKWKDLEEESSPLIMRVCQIKYARAEEIAQILQNEHVSFLSKRGRIRIDARTNKICIQDSKEYVDQARKVIHDVDIPVQQVLLEARLVSIDSDFERELGIQFAVSNKSHTPLQTEMGRYSLAVSKLADSTLLDVKLSALENAGHAELISSPSLFTANQQTASIEAGEEVPYQEVSESGGTAVVFKKAVLGLKVTPQILPKNRVLLQLQINQDRPSSKMIQGMPTISTRQMTANVLAQSDQTIVLGGIYEANTENAQSGFPFINHVPIISLLFQQHNVRRNKRELLIFVTPRIVNMN